MGLNPCVMFIHVHVSLVHQWMGLGGLVSQYVQNTAIAPPNPALAPILWVMG